MAIELATFEQIATILTQLGTNYSNLFTDYFNIFYSNEPMDVTLQYYDEAGALQTITIPNRAKDRRYILNGEGAPEGSVSGQAGALYQDLLNGNVYIKQVSASDVNGWEKIISAEDLSEFISKGSGSPEGIVSKSKGALYIDMTNSVLYVKKSATGTEGWEAITVDTSNLANVDLSNLSNLGEMHFANVDLSNLSLTGQNRFADRNLSNITNDGKAVIQNTVGSLINNKVSKTGDTMTGDLAISSDDGAQVKIIHPTEVAGTTPSSEQATGVRFYDKNGTLLGYVQNVYNSDAKRVTMLNCRNADGTLYSNIMIGYDSNGNVYTSVPTPPSTSNDSNIATTAFCDGNWTKVSSSQLFSSLNLNNEHDYSTQKFTVLPNDGKLYEMIISARVTPGATSGNQAYCRLNVAINGDTSTLRLPSPGLFLGNVRNRGYQDYAEGSSILFAKRNDTIVVSRNTSIHGTLDLWVLAYRRVR